MMDQKNSLKTIASIALATIAILIIFSLVYFKERVFFLDASYIAFKAINEQKLQIQQYRFGSFITQIVPVLGSKLQLSLKSILIAYSASFNVFYFLVASILFFWFKAYRLVILFAFYLTLITTQTFFWTNNEVHQGIAWMFLFFGAFLYSGAQRKNLILPITLLIVLATTALFSHPLVLVPFVYLWVFLLFEKDFPFSSKHLIFLSSITVAIVVTRIYVSKTHASYDDEHLARVSHLKLKEVLESFTKPFAIELYRRLFTNYWAVVILFFLGIGTMLQQKKFMLTTWTLICCLSFLVANLITFDSYITFYSESELMPGIILATTPFVFLTLPALKNKKIAVLAIALVLLIRLSYIPASAKLFTERVAMIDSIIEKMRKENISKLILTIPSELDKKWIMEWAIPNETLLYSAVEGDEPVKNFAIVKEQEVDWRVPKDQYHLYTWFELFPHQNINKHYFSFDTTQTYILKKYAE